MSWTDPCGNCGENRADCSCPDGYSTVSTKEEDKKVTWGTSLGSTEIIPSMSFKELQERYKKGDITIVVFPKKVVKNE